MSEMAGWLHARIADDAPGHAWACRLYDVIPGNPDLNTLMAEPANRLDPEQCDCRARVHLLDIVAKRMIIDLHVGGVSYPDECGLCNETLPCQTVRLLGLPYAGCAGFREDWRP